MRFFTVVALLVVCTAPQALAFPVKVGEAPFNDLALTVEAIETAKAQLLVNIYELSSKEVAAALIDRVKAGVHVEILEEGQPAFGMSYASREILAQIGKAMEQMGNGDHLFVMTSKNPDDVHRRYRFNHAKYIIVDGERLLIGSENYSPTGNPVPGKLGNRGWEVLAGNPDLAAHFAKVFAIDADLSVGDVIEVTAGSSAETREAPVSLDGLTETLQQIAASMPVLEADNVTPIFAPDDSLDKLVSLLGAATDSIELQQMTLDAQWGRAGTKSPLVNAIILAARRGVKVRVLLNDERVFEKPGRKPARHKNQESVDILNRIAQNENLKLEARIADVQAMGVDYIHNKGMLIDGRYTLISSINWNQNSVVNNRESAVVLESADINAHYLALFEKDWQASDDGIREDNGAPENGGADDGDDGVVED